MGIYLLGLDIGVRMTSRKVCVKKKTIHYSIPNMRGLLMAINIFLKVVRKVKVILNRAKRSFHVYFFLQNPMQECEFNIHFMDLPFI